MQKRIILLGLGLLALQLASPVYGQSEKPGTAAQPAAKAAPAKPETSIDPPSSTTAPRLASVESPAVSQARPGGKAARTCKLAGAAATLASKASSSTLSCRQQCAPDDDLCIQCCMCLARGGDPSRCCQ